MHDQQLLLDVFHAVFDHERLLRATLEEVINPFVSPVILVTPLSKCSLKMQTTAMILSHSSRHCLLNCILSNMIHEYQKLQNLDQICWDLFQNIFLKYATLYAETLYKSNHEL